MKIQVLADLHTEWNPFRLQPVEADAIVLCGDIGPASNYRKLRRATKLPILAVAGNHEFYRHDVDETLLEMSALEGITFLENSTAVVGGVRFLGCTLWSDFHGFSTEDKKWVAERVNDFILITRGGKRFTPDDAAEMHQISRKWLEGELSIGFDGPTVVVTHHAPHLRTQYAPSLIGAAFRSDLTPLMGKMKLWLYGHTHEYDDRTIDGTRVFSNQCGYPWEKLGFVPTMTVKI